MMDSLCRFPLSIPLPPIPFFTTTLPSFALPMIALPFWTPPCPLDDF
jgi:hypothetical protein